MLVIWFITIVLQRRTNELNYLTMRLRPPTILFHSSLLIVGGLCSSCRNVLSDKHIAKKSNVALTSEMQK